MNADPIDIAIGERLRALRIQRDLTLKELGSALAVTYQQIQKYESGSNRMAAATMYQAASVLDVSVNDFFAGLDQPSRVEPCPEATRAALGLGRITDPNVSRAVHLLIRSLGEMQHVRSGG